MLYEIVGAGAITQQYTGTDRAIFKVEKPIEFTLADTAIGTSIISEKCGTLLVQAGDDSGVFAIKNTDATVATELLSGSTNITATKDNADTLNVYVEGGVVVVQNLLGSEVTVEISGSVL